MKDISSLMRSYREQLGPDWLLGFVHKLKWYLIYLVWAIRMHVLYLLSGPYLI